MILSGDDFYQHILNEDWSTKESLNMEAGGQGLIFIVTDTQSGRKCLFKYEQYSTFEKSCKVHFDYPLDLDVVFELEDDAVEISESMFADLDDKTKLRIRPKHDSSNSQHSASRSNEQERRETGSTEFSSEDKRQADKSVKAETDETKHSWSSQYMEQFTSGAEYVLTELKRRGKDQLKFIPEEASKITVQSLAIAVIGSSGQGKSLLINTLRDLRSDDEGWAPVGETETTMKCIGYKHPIYPNLVFWDIPGMGTKLFPKVGYLSAIQFDRYDFYLICSSTRFTEDDVWLVKEVKKRKKKCYFLRTKVDIDIQNAQRMKAVSESDKLKEIREYCRNNLSDEHEVFLINCFEKNQYDFPLFLQTLLADAPEEQNRSLTLGLVSVSVEMIEQKAMYLKSEIWKTAAISALGGVVFIPGFSFGVDAVLILGKIKEYRRHFELTDAHIKKYAESIGLPEQAFRETAGLRIDFDLIAKEGINYLVKSVAVEMMAEEAIRFVPIIGTTIAAGMSYRTTGYVLEKILDGCKHDAIAVFTLATRRQTGIY